MKLTTILLIWLVSCSGWALPTISKLIGPDDLTLPAGHITKTLQALYVFDIDLNTDNGSACNNACAEKWPPILVTDEHIEDIELSDKFGTITRDSGLPQLTIDDRPVYTYFKDKNPLHANGDGAGGVWHIAE